MVISACFFGERSGTREKSGSRGKGRVGRDDRSSGGPRRRAAETRCVARVWRLGGPTLASLFLPVASVVFISMQVLFSTSSLACRTGFRGRRGIPSPIRLPCHILGGHMAARGGRWYCHACHPTFHHLCRRGGRNRRERLSACLSPSGRNQCQESVHRCASINRPVGLIQEWIKVRR